MNSHTEKAMGKPSASGFDSEFRCLGKRALCKQLPESPDSAASRRGTIIHAALASSDLSALSASDQKTAEQCFYHEAAIVHEYGFEGSQVWWEDHEEAELRLDRLWDTGDDFELLWSAQLDSLHLRPGGESALCNDYKTGFGVNVPILYNWQVRAQATLAALCPQSPAFGAEQIVGALIHPHHPDSPYEAISYKREQLEQFLITIRGTVALIERDDQPRTPNRVSCAYCPARGVCPEYIAAQEKLIQAVKDEREQKGFAALLRLTPEERAIRLHDMKALEKVLKDERAKFVALMKDDPEAVKGWKLRNSWDRKITDEGRAMEITKATFGETALSHSVKFSVTALEDYLKLDMKAEEAKEATNAALRPVMTFKMKEAFPAEVKS